MSVHPGLHWRDIEAIVFRAQTSRRTQQTSLADGAAKRTEVLWINPSAVDGLAGQLSFERA